MPALGEQPRENLAGLLQFGLCLRRAASRPDAACPAPQVPSLSQLQLRIVRLSFDKGRKDWSKSRGGLNDRLPRLVTVGALECSAEEWQCKIVATVHGPSRGESCRGILELMAPSVSVPVQPAGSLDTDKRKRPRL